MDGINISEPSWEGKRLGKYKILKLLGCGAMGAVYQARHITLERIVCLKILFASLIQPGKNIIKRFFQEARAIASLDHPNID